MNILAFVKDEKPRNLTAECKLLYNVNIGLHFHNWKISTPDFVLPDQPMHADLRFCSAAAVAGLSQHQGQNFV